MPSAIASGVAYSSGRCETPFRHGINTIATGAIGAIKFVSWYARDTIRLKRKGEPGWEGASTGEHHAEDPYYFFGLPRKESKP